MVDYAKVVAKGAVIAIIMTVLATVFSYLFRILLANNLSVEEYGLFFATLSFFMILSIFVELGLGKSSSKKIVELIVDKDYSSVKNLLFSVFVFQLAVCIILAIPLYIFAPNIVQTFFQNSNTPAFLFMLIWFLLTPFRVFISALYTGTKQINAISLYNFLKQLFFVLFSFVILYVGSSYAPYIAYIFSTIILALIYVPFVPKFFKGFFKLNFKFKKNLLLPTLSYGLLLSFVTLSTLILTQTDTLMISFFKGTEATGLYQVAVPAAMLITFFVSPLVVVSFPYITELFKKKDLKKLNIGMGFIYKYSFLLSMPLAILMFTFPELVISLLFGSKFLEATLILQVLSIMAIFSVILSLNNNALGASGFAKKITTYLVLVAILNIILNLFLIPVYGILGGAISTLVSNVVAFILSSFFVTKYLKVIFPLKEWGLIFVVSILVSILIFVLKFIFDFNLFLEIIVIGLIAGLVYVSLLWSFKVISYKELVSNVFLILRKK